MFNRIDNYDPGFLGGDIVSKHTDPSDVNYLLTEVLPVLNKGVIIHFHDIYFPFEYTREYLLDLKLLWNEAYSVHNFLLFNNSFKILFFSDYMRLRLAEDSSFAKSFPLAGTSDF